MKALLVPPGALNNAVVKRLQEFEEIQAPVWAAFAKTGSNKERPPTQENWWHIRAAAILRKIAIKGPIGTQKLRVLYGSRKNRGHKPDQFREASGNIIRKILQQLEQAGLVKQEDIQGHKGRVLTPKGHSLIDKATNEVLA